MEHDIMTQEDEGRTEPTVPAADQESGDTSGSDASEAGFSDTDAPASEQASEGAQGTEPSTPTEEKTDAQSTADKPDAAAVNAANAERRREAERRRAEERERVRRETILEVTGGVNPYTGEQMKDERDVAEYLEMREIERQGGEPVSDFAKYHKKFERERAEQRERDQQIAEQRARIDADRVQFVSSHPDVDLGELFADNEFVSYASEKLGKVSLSEIYDGYTTDKQQKVTAENERIESRARELAVQMVANANASPGSAVGAPQASSEVFTPERVRRMSREEVRANYDKIQASMKYWK